MPQVYLLAGLLVTVAISGVLASMWLMGGLLAVLRFLPAAMAFFLVVLNCQSLKRLRIMVSVVTVIAILYVVQGGRAYLAAESSNSYSECRTTNKDDPQRTSPETSVDTRGVQACSPLLEVIHLSDGTVNFRMQGLGFLHDANLLAQLLVMLVPFLWLRWRQNQHLHNLFLVIAPTALFVWGIYLTHSRGAMVALVVILILALRRRVGLVPTVAGAVLAASLLLALNFSGGRDVSVEAGTDRFVLWGDGLQMFKQNPLFGVGLQNFPSMDFGHTAHNSFVVCLAELGIIGYSLWMGLLVFTLSGLNSLIASVRQGQPGTLPVSLERDESPWLSEPDKSDFEKWATALQISLGGFLAAAFFLSRAYAFTLYVILGMAVALLSLASEAKEPIARKSVGQLIGLTAKMGFAAIALVYLCLRARSVLS
jgi:O-antigen ligase